MRASPGRWLPNTTSVTEASRLRILRSLPHSCSFSLGRQLWDCLGPGKVCFRPPFRKHCPSQVAYIPTPPAGKRAHAYAHIYTRTHTHTHNFWLGTCNCEWRQTGSLFNSAQIHDMAGTQWWSATYPTMLITKVLIDFYTNILAF